MAGLTDKLRKTFAGATMTLDAAIGISDTTLTLSSIEGLPQDTAIDLVIDRVDSTGKKTPDLKEIVTAVVAGSGISILRGVGGTAQSHNAGAIVEASISSAASHNDLITTMMTIFNLVGTLKNRVIHSAHIAESAVTNEKLAGDITYDKLADDSKQSAQSIETDELVFSISETQPTAISGKTIVWFKPKGTN